MDREKQLYERLDTVASGLARPDLTLPDLLEVVRVLGESSLDVKLRAVAARWRRSHSE